MELNWFLLLVGGAGAGFINAIAGGGSVLTLPILMLSGLDASVANGTNRLASAARCDGRWCILWPGRTPQEACSAVHTGPLLVPVGSVVAVRIPPMGQEGVFGFIFITFAQCSSLIQTAEAAEGIQESSSLVQASSFCCRLVWRTVPGRCRYASPGNARQPMWP